MSSGQTIQAFCGGNIDGREFDGALRCFIRVIVLYVGYLPVAGRVRVLFACGGFTYVVRFEV